MNRIKVLVAIATACCLMGGVAMAQSKAPSKAQSKAEAKLTCCEKALADGKECRNKCCVAAHRQGKSCEKCNPEKQDLAVMKKLKEKHQQKKKKEVAAPAR